MDVVDVRKRVEQIRGVVADDEAAHSREDRLWEDVLTAIAKADCPEAKLALAALETRHIEFGRWCA